MFTPNNTGVSATRQLVVTNTLNPLQSWWDMGIRDSQTITYTTILQAVIPGHGGGQAQNRFIGEACVFWEDINQTLITDLAPNLPTSRTRGEWHTNLEG